MPVIAHTPGPWRAVLPFSPKVFTGEMLVCDIRGWGHLTGVGGLHLSADDAIAIQAANAHIIAAAPELLDALKEFMFINRRSAATSVFAKAEAAIAKAEGRS